MIHSILRCCAMFLALTLALLSAGTATAQSNGRASTVIVYDVSNSMWGQVEGRSKIEIAREVIGDLLQDWDPAVDLGLVAYGHRKAGDCGDIEQVIPVGPVDPASFSATINSLVPRGKTPLTDAVREAAEILNYRDTRATVILVSDGIESCNADPCALAAELERGGIDFTAHVVGFDVGRIEDQRQLSCLADTTGGRYLTADTAGELMTALRTVAAPPPPPPPMLRLEAVDSTGRIIADSSLRWTVVALGREETILGGEPMASPRIEVPAGRYFARAEIGNRAGSVEFDYSGEADALHQVVLAVAVSLDAPAEAEASTAINVTWTGPNAAGDYIALVEPGAAQTSFIAYARTSGGSPASLTLPNIPGDYALRYVDAAGGKVLAEVAIAITGANATLEAAPVVEAGSAFDVTWTGPDNPNDYITIVAAGADAGATGNYAYTRQGSPLKLDAADQPGAYELRYISSLSRSALARLPITVTGVSATLEAAPSIGAGDDIAVTWTGPDNTNDFVTIVPVGEEEGKFGDYAYTRNGSPLKVRAPDTAGSYELRYVTGQTATTLARLPIAVTATAATLEAPPTIGAGADIKVTWTGPDNTNDFVTIVPTGEEEGKFGTYSYTRNGSPAKVRAPDEPGSYELRYMTGQTRTTLASLPITVTEVGATLEAPPTIGAGADIKVTWTGPDSTNDFVTIVPTGTDEGKFGAYSYTRNGSPAKVRAPDEPGSFELRYVTGQSKSTLASLPITVTEVGATLEAPPTIGAGADIAITWTGPDNTNDFVTIVPTGEEEGKFGTYSYTRNGSPAKVRAPDEPGSYELRYMTGQTRATLASLPITVNEVTASLEADPVVDAGADIKVTWTGPDNTNDFVTVVPKGEEEGKFGKYTYTRNGSPLKLRAPEDTGSYELRYMTGQSRTTLARIPITVRKVEASLEAPPSGNAGADVSVIWSGPNNKGDFLTIVPTDTPEGKFGHIVYLSDGKSAKLRMPETPGAYELRYVTGQSRQTLAQLPLTALPVTASLAADPAAAAGGEIQVTWTGPDNHRDYISIALGDQDARKYVTSVFTRKGSPLRIKLPKEPGVYEIRYVTGGDQNILARLPLTVN